MTHEDLVAHYGSATQAARALGYSKQSISHWKRAGIPFDAQFRIQLKTKGKLKANLPERRKRESA